MSNWTLTKLKLLRSPKVLLLAIVLGVGSATATGFVVAQSFSRQPATVQKSSANNDIISASEIGAVAALGRLEPKGEVIYISAPSEIGGTRVKQLLVKRGDKILSGQAIAILDNRDRLKAALEKARTQMKVAQARLHQVQAGAKQGAIESQQKVLERSKAEQRGEIATQNAEIERLEAELNNAKIEYQRYERLYQEGAVSASVRDSKHLQKETSHKRVIEAKQIRQKLLHTLQNRVAQAQATLNEISEVRPTDVAVARAELENAQAGVRLAQANLDLAYVRSPRDGQILKIHTFSGETIDKKGIVSLGQTNQMYVVAEVYETDISWVRSGQRASITSRGFTDKLQGTVDEIGLEVAKKDVLQTDPAADVDARVVEVKIRLSPRDSLKVAGLTNLQVHTVIHIR